MNIKKIFETYRSYLPALMTAVGASLVAAGLFRNDNNMRLYGALLAAGGAFWSGHRQIASGAEARARNEKIIELSEKLRDAMTGGDSFCYGYPYMLSSGQFQWSFVHSGKEPLYDVQVRICDRRKRIHSASMNLQLGTLFPGRAHSYGMQPGSIDVRTPVQAFNLFFVARNGSWTQEIRWIEKPGVQATANRVVRDGMPVSEPLLLEVSPEYDGETPQDDAWNALPPGFQHLP
ncbi:Uncharacterised protein [Burkholderia pseudomallei]|uniref:hypothetical protein n=1 Tax=Burkholderia pseudomallei TaxID=28450 RepID=UPI000F23575B|nr:hypothetical protein [Burkholderia pseudomallei]VBM56247.1 Uncharacterised protein [Burkholderia pseudomallei]